jgi:hypothetical protein
MAEGFWRGTDSAKSLPVWNSRRSRQVAMEDDRPAEGLEPREPTIEDLRDLCRGLNEAGVRYVVVSGFAIRAASYIRRTMDIDLIVAADSENEARNLLSRLTKEDQVRLGREMTGKPFARPKRNPRCTRSRESQSIRGNSLGPDLARIGLFFHSIGAKIRCFQS